MKKMDESNVVMYLEGIDSPDESEFYLNPDEYDTLITPILELNVEEHPSGELFNLLNLDNINYDLLYPTNIDQINEPLNINIDDLNMDELTSEEQELVSNIQNQLQNLPAHVTELVPLEIKNSPHIHKLLTLNLDETSTTITFKGIFVCVVCIA